MPKTVIQHVPGRLKDIGINDIFGVPGDFAFTTQDAIVGCGSASYIEVVTDEYAAPPLPQKMHESRDTLYAR